MVPPAPADATLARAMHRFQLVDADGTAWLLSLTGTAWFADSEAAVDVSDLASALRRRRRFVSE